MLSGIWWGLGKLAVARDPCWVAPTPAVMGGGGGGVLGKGALAGSREPFLQTH